jgi:hypothetical protein
MTIVQDLGSDSEDETKVTTMGIKGKSFVASFSSCTSSAKSNVIPDGRKKMTCFIYELSQSTLRLIHLLIVDHK